MRLKATSSWKYNKNQSKVLSSLNFQSSKLPSGKYLRTIKGIFFSLSSFSAIVKGSQFMSELLSAVRYKGEFLEIWTALTPMILAFSYFVMNGDVILSTFGLSYTASYSWITWYLFSSSLECTLSRSSISSSYLF